MQSGSQDDDLEPAGDPYVPPEPQDFMPRLVHANNNLVNAFEKVCGISLPRWRLLFNLAHKGKSSQNELARSTIMGPAAITRILVDMERQGLVRREPSPTDSRQLVVELTPAGVELVRATAARREGFIESALAGFSDVEVALLERLLHHMEKNLAAMR